MSAPNPAQAHAQAIAAAAADSLNIQMLLAASQHISTDTDITAAASLGVQNGVQNAAVRQPTPTDPIRTSPSPRPASTIPQLPPVNASTPEPVNLEQYDAQSVELWLVKRKKQQSEAQSRYRVRQKMKTLDLRHELDRLKTAAKENNIKVDDPDDIMNVLGVTKDGYPPSDDDMPPTPKKSDTADTLSGKGAETRSLTHSWSVTPSQKLADSAQAKAQRKYRLRLKEKNARLQRQVECYRRALAAHNIVIPDNATLYVQYVADPSAPVATGTAPAPSAIPAHNNQSAASLPSFGLSVTPATAPEPIPVSELASRNV